MKYRVLGKTGWKVSVLGFGAAPLGGTHGKVDEKDAVRAVRTAIDLGINFIDVAPYYGRTMAETLLGKALQGISREKYFLATKVGRYGPEETDFDFSPERLARSVDESLRRLRVAHIDLIHGGWVPSPRNDSDASTSIAVDSDRLVCTRMIGARLGSRCRPMMRRSRAPMDRAAST